MIRLILALRDILDAYLGRVRPADPTLWHKWEPALYGGLGQLWRRWHNGRWEYRRDEETEDELASRQW